MNGLGPNIFARASASLLRKDAGPLAPKIQKSPIPHKEDSSSDTSTKDKTGLGVASKEHDARSDPVSKKNHREP